MPHQHNNLIRGYTLRLGELNKYGEVEKDV